MEHYNCDICGETYERTRSDEECYKEMEELMPEAVGHQVSIVCDDCHIEFMEWFKKLTPEQKNKMREDYIREVFN